VDYGFCSDQVIDKVNPKLRIFFFLRNRTYKFFK
jgi:hypothetical protein